MKIESTSNRKVISNSIIYTISGLLMKCFSFFLLPLYTAYLSTADYGITSIASSFSSTMQFVIAFSLYSAVMRFYVDYKEDKQALKRFYGTIVVFVFISGLFFFVLFSLLKDALSKYVFAGVDYYPIIFVCLISLIFTCQYTIYDNILKSQQRAVKSSILSFTYFLVSVTLNIIFVVVLRLGALGVLLATGIASLLYTVFFVADVVIHREIEFCIDIKILKEALKYSVPIMPHDLATHIAQLVSRVLIGGTVSVAALGIYTVATQFATIADTIQTYVSNAYQPWIFEKIKKHDDEYKTSIRSVVNLLISVIGLFFIGISLFAQDYIILFVNRDYFDAWKYVPLAVMVYGIKTIYYFYIAILFYYKKASKKLFVATLSSSIINVLLSAVLIPMFEAYGSILADAISMFVRVFIVIWLSKQYESIGLSVSDFVKNYVIIATFTFVGLLLSIFKCQYKFSIFNFAYKLLIVALYVLFIAIQHKDSIRPIMIKLKSRKFKK